MCSYAGYQGNSYTSRELKVHEKNYPTLDLELAVVVFSSKHKCLRNVIMQRELCLR